MEPQVRRVDDDQHRLDKLEEWDNREQGTAVNPYLVYGIAFAGTFCGTLWLLFRFFG